jgi:hypothetical protein
MALDLKTGVGVSTNSDDRAAGIEAATRAIENLNGKIPDAVIVFAAPKFKHQKMLDGISSVTKKAPMIGGTTAGEISTFGLSVNSVVVMALKSKDISIQIGMGKGIGKNEEKAGSQLAKSVLKNSNKKKAKTLIVLPDGLAGDGLKIIKGVQKILGKNFEIVGGTFGDEANFKNTYQYYNGKVYQDVVVGMLISGSKFSTATGVRSGWESVGSRIKCTKAKGNVVYKFGNKSALEVYRESLGPARAKKLPAIGLEYPMGLVDERAEGEGYDYFQIRAPLAINEKEGSVTFAAAIPEGSEVTLTYSSRNSIIKGSKLSAQQAKKTLENAKPRIVMIFSCVARKMVLGRRTNEEINSVKQVFGKSIPIIGFYTYGEIGPIDKRIPTLKSARLHNETLVIWALGG